MKTLASPREPQSRLDYIDVLRGFACLWVLLFHCLLGSQTGAQIADLPIKLVNYFSSVGWLGVNLFLILSGFCLYYPYIRREERSDVRIDLKKFAKRRALRILPPYYAALFFYVASGCIRNFLHHTSPLADVDWKSMLLHLTMTHNLSVKYYDDFNPVFWSLALESQLYIIFPILVYLLGKKSDKFVLLTTIGISIIWQLLVFWHYGFSFAWMPHGAWYDALPGRCFEFAAGMVTASLIARPKPQMVRAIIIAALILVLPCTYFSVFVSRYGPFIDQLWCVVFCGLILQLNLVRKDIFASNWFVRGWVSLGIISYSLYLTHTLTFSKIYSPLVGNLTWKYLAFTIVRILLAIVVASIFFLLFERPFLGKKKSREGLVVSTATNPAP